MYPMLKFTHADTGLVFYLAPDRIHRVESRKDTGALIFTPDGRINIKEPAEAVIGGINQAIGWKESRVVQAQLEMASAMHQKAQSGLVVPQVSLNGN